ncbi:acyl-CoA dehydrogenase family protein [Streptomyces sp. NBC_00659]|uniref:acyl-CoA dehydrogenase family protein n=1 Tax=Streptomyces sp. NBC_00659 TaxID=2903669 RepID=UPI002E30383E|nr:acyl-CoA dehydrogenase family protein [Streptomyces sp. NBC_00659]
MTGALTAQQEQARKEFRAFRDRHMAPCAGTWHRARRTPPEIIRLLADEGLLGLYVPRVRRRWLQPGAEAGLAAPAGPR